MRVRKRNGTYEPLMETKIQRSIVQAIISTGAMLHTEGVVRLVNRVMEQLPGGVDMVESETIGGVVESVLMESGHFDAAKRYILYRSQQGGELLEPDNTMLGDYIHGTKYARYIESKGRRETFNETVDRWAQQHRDHFGADILGSLASKTLGDPASKDLFEQAVNAVRRKDLFPSMRAFQFGGKAVSELNARQYNCTFIRAEREDVFQKILYMLLCGCGVGYSVQHCHVEKLPAVETVDRDIVQHHTVGDTIVGWCEALRFLIASYMGGKALEMPAGGDWITDAKKGVYVEFDYSRIRAKGTPLVTSGGRAPGHMGLKESLEQIRAILNKASGRKLRPVEVHDIICWIAVCVLSGGIRRSSLIALFSPEDTEMLYCKAAGNFEPRSAGNMGLNSQREMANNSGVIVRNSYSHSVVGDSNYLFRRLIETGQQNYGDPGFLFVNHLDEGTNPCGEIGLNPVFGGAQFCNLCEINGATCEGVEDFTNRCRLASLLGTLQAAYTRFDYLGWETEYSTQREALLGISIMGIYDNLALFKDAELLRQGVEAIREVNEAVASVVGINAAARLTTIKPGGTAPLEAAKAGIIPASGITPHHAAYYFRRVTASKTEPLARAVYETNPHLVEEKPDGDWSIVFPIHTNGVVLDDVSTREHVDMIMHVYKNWVKPGTVVGLQTHNVSCTVVCGDDDLDWLVDHLWSNRDSFAAMSFVPPTLDTLYAYAPRKAVRTHWDKERWNQLVSMTKPMDFANIVEHGDNTERRDAIACAGGVCEI